MDADLYATEKLFLNLNQLLEDICSFLTTESLQQNLTSKHKKLAETLIKRSKEQLQEISKVDIVQNDEYVDMDPKNKDEKTSQNQTGTYYENVVFPYHDLAARDASRSVKHGYLNMKRKFLLGFEKMKRVYGSLHSGWLLIYFTDKDAKPIAGFDLKNFEATEGIGEKNANFELTSTTSEDKKKYYFTALTHKDMIQWVTNINKCHDQTVIGLKASITIEEPEVYSAEEEKEEEEKEDSENSEYQNLIFTKNRKSQDTAKIDVSEEEDEDDCEYQQLRPKQNNHITESDEENIYNEVDPVIPHLNNRHKAPNIRAALPGRPKRKNVIPVPPPVVKVLIPPEKNNSDESPDSYDDIMAPEEAKGNLTGIAFKVESSEDEDDCDEDGEPIYEAFKGVSSKKTKPALLLKPHVPAVPPLSLMPKLGSPASKNSIKK